MKETSLIILLSLIGCNDGANKMIISGNIEGLKKGTLYLQKQQDSIITSLDSISVDGSSEFVLETEIEEPDIYYLYLDKNDGDSLNDIITFFGNVGEININTRLQTFDSGYKIIGSKNSELLEEYLSIIRKFNFSSLIRPIIINNIIFFIKVLQFFL